MTWRERLEAIDLPPIPTRIGLVVVAILFVFVVLPPVDRFGYIFGIVTLAMLLLLVELGREPRPVVDDEVVRSVILDAYVGGVGGMYRTQDGSFVRLDPESIAIRRPRATREDPQPRRPDPTVPSS
jgi:hypothetical protein